MLEKAISSGRCVVDKRLFSIKSRLLGQPCLFSKSSLLRSSTTMTRISLSMIYPTPHSCSQKSFQSFRRASKISTSLGYASSMPTIWEDQGTSWSRNSSSTSSTEASHRWMYHSCQKGFLGSKQRARTLWTVYKNFIAASQESGDQKCGPLLLSHRFGIGASVEAGLRVPQSNTHAIPGWLQPDLKLQEP